MKNNSVISISQLTKSFGNRTVLDISSLSFSKETIYALTGHNGSGKTTFLRILANLEQPTTGSVKILEGIQIGFCSQKPYMFRGSVLKNLIWGMRNVVTDQLDTLVHNLQLESILDNPAKKCSSGEIQKISLGRMILHQPNLLLLDEPTANLDSQSRAIIEDEILRFSRNGGTCILATHMTDQALRLSSEIIRLEQGRITHAETMNIFEGILTTDNNETFIKINNALTIICNEPSEPGRKRFCISPNEVVLSLQPLESSMRNSFSGTVTSLRKTSGPVEIIVDIGLPLLVHITQKSLSELKLSLGSKVIASFKASSVKFL